MHLNFYNCPEPRPFNPDQLPTDVPFLDYEPNFQKMQELVDKYRDKENLIVIGHGGSISSFYGIYHALRESVTKRAHFVSTIDPDRLAEIKQLAPRESSLVIAISKSGETVTQLEALLQFLDYEKVFITGAMGPLAQLAEKIGADLLPHPPIGGRFTGFTEVALFPALLCGLDAMTMLSAGKEYLRGYRRSNEAYVAADIMVQLESGGFVDVFLPIYDAHLFPFTQIIVQLCHESFGKENKGQTYFASEAPEAQHHTNQRFLGGRRNVAGWFLSSEQSLRQLSTQVPEELRAIPLRDGRLGMLDGLSLEASLHSELQGTLMDARIHSIPVVTQTVVRRDAQSIARLLAFWQLYAIYAAVARALNPFDQPQVEHSKKLSFDERLSASGHR